MRPIEECNLREGGQHFWITLPKGEGLQCYACPMCQQLVYWSDANKSFIKPVLSGGKPIKGNASPLSAPKTSK